MCVGRHAFDIYSLLPPMVDSLSASPTECSGDPLTPCWQCGGQEWQGSTCCEDGYEC
ncbi:unnamed protein product, partial [Hapterophycus canaliculatus]